MNFRRNVIVKSAIAGLTLVGMLTVTPTMAQDSSQEPTVSTANLRGGIYMLHGAGGNVVASVGGDGVLIIDDDFPQYAPAYEQALLDIGMKTKAPRFLLNTHWHMDHAGSNTYWGERGSVIVSHDSVRTRLSTRQELKAFDMVVEASPPVALPVITFAQSLALHFNGDDIEMQYYPGGHTDGDSVIFFTETNVVHMGDNFFNARFPFIDIGSSGSVKGYIDCIQDVLGRIDDDTIVVPGHGSVGNKADLSSFLDMIVATSAIVTAKLDKGMTVEEITEQGLGDQWESWGQHTINEATWISLLLAAR